MKGILLSKYMSNRYNMSPARGKSVCSASKSVSHILLVPINLLFHPPQFPWNNLQCFPQRKRYVADTSNMYFMQDQSCNRAGPKLLVSCYLWIYSMLGWDKFLSAHCGWLCYTPPRATVYHEAVHNYVFTCPSLFSVRVSLPHCVFSSSSDFGLPRDPGPGARRVCQPPLPCWWDPKSQTPLAEEWHGSAS